MVQKKKALMAVSNYYTSVFQVGSHHYARAFEKLGYEVAYISYPISPLHAFSSNKNELIEREKIYRQNGIYSNNIWYYLPKALLTPSKATFLSSNFLIDNWYKFSYPNLINLLKDKNFNKINILWLESAVFSFLLEELEYDYSILRLLDYSRGFPNFWNSYCDKESMLINKVNRVIYTAKNLKEKYNLSSSIDSMYIPNGVDIEFFENADKSFPEEFNNIESPRIIYIGSINAWFDLDLMHKTAKTLSNYNFIIIGPVHTNISKLKELKNLYFLGSKPHNKIAQFLTHSDVGIIPFKVNELIHSVHPVKLYEYMICGLPVVSMQWDELQTMQSPAYLAKNYDDFINYILKAIQSKQKEHYINYANNYSWNEKLKNVLNNYQ